jgi:DMSO/TMAO reductase YedYZ molybdopterin-dependent catalytic subunit
VNKKFFYHIIVFAVLISISFAFIVKETQPSSNKLAMAKGLFEKQLEISLNNAKDITKNDEFFALSIKGVPEINIEKYRLTIDGLVDKPLTLKYNDLREIEHKTETETLTCIALISAKAVWSGIPVKTLLDMAGANKGATEVIFYAADGYSSSIPIKEAYSDRVILATHMNGEILPDKHGFPLRLVYPEHYGYKWVKWVDHIKVVNYDYKGFWESQGYSDEAKIKKP